jgi:hypothetical protein
MTGRRLIWRTVAIKPRIRGLILALAVATVLYVSQFLGDR